MTCRCRLIGSYLFEGVRTSIIMGSGDILAQTAVDKKPLKEVNLVRTMKFASLGFFLVGPLLKFWYTLLDKRVPLPQDMKRSVKKMLIDQAVMAPTLNLTITTIVGLMNHDSTEVIKDRLQTQYPKVMKANYMLWPWVQIANFGFVPLQYQVVAVQVVAVIWNCILSKLINVKKSV